ncbi:MAG: hypothetical protein WBP22_04535 [Candidatus Saccharimonas sp.]
MELPKYNHQPDLEQEDTERWINEGGHLIGDETPEADNPDESTAPDADLDSDNKTPLV